MSFSEWKEGKLSDLINFFNGKKRPNNQGDIPVYGGNGVMDYCDTYNTEGENLIIGRVGAYCGNVYYLNGRCWISDNAILGKANANAHSRFLYYCMANMKLGKQQIGSSQPLITQGILKSLEVSYPDFIEQKSIAHILSTLDEKIEVNNQINKNLESMAQALFKQWFIDFEFPNENGEPYKSSGGEMVESELGLIPKGWDTATIADVAYINKDTYSEKENWSFVNYLDTGNITQNCVDDIQRIDVQTDKLPSRARRKIKKNDIVFSTVRPNQLHYGLIKEPNENLLASTGFAVIRRNSDRIVNEYIYLWLTRSEIVTHLQSVGETSTSTYPAIKASDIEVIRMVIPTGALLVKTNEIMSSIYTQIHQLQKESKNLGRIRDTLLIKLMSGEIRVPQ